MKPPKPSPRKKDRDLLDKIEDFIEHRVEHKIKKGLDGLETFLKRELKDLKAKALERDEEERGPFRYLETFLKDKNVAAVAPSTKFLVAKVLRRMDKGPRAIIEYGPAEGVMTKQLLARLPPDGRLLGVELNEDFAATLAQKLKDPRLTALQGSVLEIDAIAAAEGFSAVDAIISGIPFSYLSPLERHQLLHKTVDLLRPGGRFIAYQVTTHLVPLMKYHFRDVDIDWEIRNLPPHFVFTGYK